MKQRPGEDLVTHRLGSVTLDPPGPVVAGSVGQWTLTYTVGSYGIDEGGTIKIARRFAADWERPQFDRPGEPAFCRVSTDGEASLAVRYDPKAHLRPWMRCIVIDVYDGCLAPGDVVTIVLGERSEGSPGIRAQTFLERAHELRVLVDPTNACLVRRLPSSPVISIVAGEPVSVVPIVPTRARVDEAVAVFLKGEDAWGNPTPPPAGVELHWEGEPAGRVDGTTLRVGAPGHGHVVATWQGRRFRSNPLLAEAEAPPLGRYWADLHAQSDATVGTGTELEYFDFGRRWAHLDVMSHQGNDFQMSDEDWRRLQDAVRHHHEDGRFVVFPGFEWSANTPAGGDRNVMYLEEGLPILRSSHWQVPEVPEDEHSPAHPADELCRRLKAAVDPSKVVVAAHCGGRYADVRRYFDPEVERLVELASCWGVFEWLLWDAYEMGHRPGVMCNSDGHKGRPGAEGPGAGQFGIHGGLTCILAESLTRASVFEALRQRRCYGTTGPRIDLDLTVEGAPMGSEIEASGRVRVEAAVRGSEPIEALLLLRGREVVARARPPAFERCAGSRRIRLSWGGARIRGRGRRAVWDGTVEVHGPRIERVETFAFDSPADGVLRHDGHEVELRSRTTGDEDGLDLWLDRADAGRVVLRTPLGELAVELAQLDATGVRRDLGGMDLHLSIRRYPELLHDTALRLRAELPVEPGQAVALMVKAIQSDGHLAWSSPVYVDGR
ncbi:MAG: DUF3604 domain-containing protein [Myxococcales bacterium]|nr:DUF3604 domain-containing protein [Myxococcales bacterium]